MCHLKHRESSAAPRFEDLGLSREMLSAIRKAGFEKPSAIQAAFIPIAVAGNDCIGQARTGTGKTAAFVIPILEQIDHEAEHPQALVLTPTRELCQQVADQATKLSVNHSCRVACIVGGKSIKQQVDALKRGAQIVVGTPGRIIDLMSRNMLIISDLQIVVLDEADRMLDIGFRPDIEKILRRCPEDRQTLLLSATLPPPVEKLANRYMVDPQKVDVSIGDIAPATIKQYCCTVDEDRKLGLLVRLLTEIRPSQVLVFTRTKRTADRLMAVFSRRLPHVACLHSDLQQTVRDRVMKQFRSGQLRMLIATDVVGRGIDVSSVTHIINYDIPESCDDYVHRIGRTGRLSSDQEGVAFTFVTKQQGEELTRVENRVNTLLEPYSVKDFDAFRAGPVRKAAGADDGVKRYGH